MLCLSAAVIATLSVKLGIPTLVAFLALGMLLGSEGPGGISFDDPALAREIATVCLVAILWEGGVSSRWEQIRIVLRPAVLLATVGVAISAIITGVVAWPVLGLDPLEGLLVGAVVASTDAAAVFATLRFVTVRRRIGSLLEAESGLNDPMAIALALGLIGLIAADASGPGDFALILVRELGIGALVAMVIGGIVKLGAPRARDLFTPFAPLASIGLATLSFGLADVLGGSGYLAVYVVGIVFGTLETPAMESLRVFHQGLAFSAELGLFLMLGLLVFPNELPAVILPGLAIAAVLALVARPIAVGISTLGADLTRKERVFVSWAGLRGGVPIVLATIALSEGISSSQEIFNAVFFVVLVSAALQGPTLGPFARRLGLHRDRRGREPEPVSRTG